MEIDNDIHDILQTVELGRHPIKEAIDRFLRSLPGYEYRYHRPLTIKSYENCLIKDPHNFLGFMKNEGLESIELITKDKLDFYKVQLVNILEPRTASKYITSVRQLFKYCHKIGWFTENIAADFTLPRAPVQKQIEIIRPEVCNLLMNGNWGLNDFTRKRNYLTLCLFLRRGLHPFEVPKIQLEHIEPYRDVAVINVEGKRGRWREVMLDPLTWKALQEYAIERGKYLGWRGVNDEHLILSSAPNFDG